MKGSERLLLIADLCGRVPYDTIVNTDGDNEVYLRSVDTFGYEVEVADYNEHVFDIEEVKPYLRPFSDMTDEEDKEFALLQVESAKSGFLYAANASNLVKFLYSHHIDFNGLIEKGLALEAPEGMYKTV